jgi:ABC-2 type transport system permease protein
MKAQRAFSLARRVIRQIVHDRRTLALVFLAPILMITLGAILFRAEPAVMPLGVVNEDKGLTVPMVGTIAVGQLIIDELTAGDSFTVLTLRHDEVDARLRDGTAQGVLVFPADFSVSFYESRQAAIDLRLEGSNPTRSRLIAARVTEAAMKTLAGLALPGQGTTAAASQDRGQLKMPIALLTSYLYTGESFDTMDFVAPVYIAFLAFFFVFLLTCVSFLRERSQGTMERLLATPASRLEIVVGYIGGLGLFAVIQVAVILFFTVWAIRIHYLGSLWLLFLVVALLAIVGVSLGILASTFARNEFQVVQFIPLVIIPQALLGGLFWAVDEMPDYLQPFAYIMPLTYANRALRDVMLKGWGLAEIWPNLLILLAIALIIIGLGVLTMRREVA